MSTVDTRIAYAVVMDMMPKPGVAGVGLDSQAYKDLLAEHIAKSKKTSPTQVDKAVRHLLETIGAFGFGMYDGREPEP